MTKLRSGPRQVAVIASRREFYLEFGKHLQSNFAFASKFTTSFGNPNLNGYGGRYFDDFTSICGESELFELGLCRWSTNGRSLSSAATLHWSFAGENCYSLTSYSNL